MQQRGAHTCWNYIVVHSEKQLAVVAGRVCCWKVPWVEIPLGLSHKARHQWGSSGDKWMGLRSGAALLCECCKCWMVSRSQRNDGNWKLSGKTLTSSVFCWANVWINSLLFLITVRHVCLWIKNVWEFRKVRSTSLQIYWTTADRNHQNQKSTRTVRYITEMKPSNHSYIHHIYHHIYSR